MKKLIIGLASIYASFTFLIASRFLYYLEFPEYDRLQVSDFSIWMSHIPFMILLVIYVPLIIGICFLISYIKDKRKQK